MTGSRPVPPSERTRGRGLGITQKILLVTVGAGLLSVLIIGSLSIWTIIQTGNTAYSTGTETLEAQTRVYMVSLATASAAQLDVQLEQVTKDAALASEYAAEVLADPAALSGGSTWTVDDDLVQDENGAWTNSTSDLSSAWSPNYVELNAENTATLEQLALMDLVSPSIYAADPNSAAVWVVHKTGMIWYHPNIGLGTILPPDFRGQDDPVFFVNAASAQNPERSAVWSFVYDDPAGQGLMATASSPIYVNGEFQGVAGIDLTLALLSQQVEALVPLEDGYAFLIDSSGRALALPGRGYEDMLGRPALENEFGPDVAGADSRFVPIVARMTNGEVGFGSIEVDGNTKLVAFAPLANIPWSIGVVGDRDVVLKVVNDLRSDLDSSTGLLIWQRIVPAGIAILVVAVMLAVWSTRRLVKPIRRLADASEGLAAGEWDQELPPAGGDEIGVLTMSFAAMTDELRRTMDGLEDRVEERTVELDAALATVSQLNERMQGELDIARDIQMSMLPLTFPAFPDRREFSIHALLEPAREVGGDFYDFFLVDDDHLCFCVGDVSDKGAGAALFMAVTTTLIKTHASVDSSPGSIMTAVNDGLAENNDSAMFVTIFLAILDLRTGDMVYCNAGHNPPYIKRPSGELVTLDQRHGLVAGAVQGVTYDQDHIRLENGDSVMVFTDGVTEAMNTSRELYSEDRLEDLLETSVLESSDYAVELVYGSVVDYRGEADQSDDITVLNTVFLGDAEMAPERLELVMVNELEAIGDVLDSISEFAEANGLDDAIRRPVLLAVDDLLNNVVSYAFKDSAAHEISLAVELSSHRLSVSFSDDGIPFNPFGAEIPEVSTGLTDREVGGLGIHLVRQLMDQYRYERRAGHNIVTIARNLDADDENA